MIDKTKIKTEFFIDLNKYLDEENEKVKTLDQTTRQILMAKATEYYQYLADNGISYGSLALEIVNNEGKYGLMANGHFKHQCIFDGIKAEEIPVIREQTIISLAYHDMAMRMDNNYHQDSNFCKSIEDYHISVFKSLATEYAWGGLVFRELMGTGSWLKLYEQGGGDWDAIKMMFKEHKESIEYSSTRLMDSIRHTWTNYRGGVGMIDPSMDDVPFEPKLDSASKEDLAKLYNVSKDRIIEIAAPESDAPMIAYKHYKILPAEYNEHKALIDAESQWSLNSSFRQQVMFTCISKTENNFKEMKLLLQKGAEVDGGKECLSADGYMCSFGLPQPVFMAISYDDIQVLQFLIEHGAKINIIAEQRSLQYKPWNYTPLHLAVNKELIEMVKFLLDSGASVSVKDQQSKTPLDYAISKGDIPLIQLLTSCNRLIDAQIENLAHKSLKYLEYNDNKQKILQILFDTGLDINQQDIKGNTILHKEMDGLLYHLHPDDKLLFITFCINNGAKIDIKNNEGNTPFDLYDRKDSRIVALIEKVVEINYLDDSIKQKINPDEVDKTLNMDHTGGEHFLSDLTKILDSNMKSDNDLLN